MIFTEYTYEALHSAVFQAGYPGYRPEVVEAPDGDGRLDARKRYAHVKLAAAHPSKAVQQHLDGYLMAAHREALRVAEALNVPKEFRPVLEAGALRVLEYPAFVGGEAHTDFDLFTILCWRDPVRALRFSGETCKEAGRLSDISEGLHMGELGELVGLGPATRHEVNPHHSEQRSIVYFALPAHTARLPNGTLVGDWVAERLARSRVEVSRGN